MFENAEEDTGLGSEFSVHPGVNYGLHLLARPMSVSFIPVYGGRRPGGPSVLGQSLDCSLCVPLLIAGW